MVLKLTHGKLSFLLTADIGSPNENQLVRNGPPLNSTGLRVTHRGGRTSSAPAFLASVGSSVGVISAGSTSSFGHQVLEVLEKLEEAMGEGAILRTDRDETIEFTSDGQALWFKTER